MRACWLLTLLLSVTAFGAPRPRVALHPIAPVGGQGVALPPSAASALLAAAATRPLELPSTFEVDDALASLAQPDCAERDACLAALAKLTHAGWAVGVTAKIVDDGSWELTGRVVDDAGAVTRAAQHVIVAPAVVGFDWAAAAASLLQSLEVDGLAVDAELQPLAAAPAPGQGEVAGPEAAPALPLPAQAPLTPAEAPATVSPPALALASPPAVGPLRGSAIVAGALAVGAAGAALTLAFVNAGEAEALRAATQGGVLPGAAVDRAVRLDERTAVATGLGLGAAVAAGAAVALWFAAPSTGPRASVAVSPSGAAAVLSGSF